MSAAVLRPGTLRLDSVPSFKTVFCASSYFYCRLKTPLRESGRDGISWRGKYWIEGMPDCRGQPIRRAEKYSLKGMNALGNVTSKTVE